MAKKEPQNLERYINYYGQIFIHDNFFDVTISFHKSKLYLDCFRIKLPYTHINYSDIIWIEEPDVFSFGKKRIDLCTKKGDIVSLYYPSHIKVTEFLFANTQLAKEKPAFLTSSTEMMDGERIRRQYFNGPIYLLSGLYISLYLFLLITNLATGKGILETLHELIVSLWVPLVWLGPLSILSFLNRSHFGKIICTLNEKGLQHEKSFVSWEQITRIEYEIVLPSRSPSSYQNRIKSCYAYIYVEDGKDLLLTQAPYMLLKAAKKYNPDIKVGFTKHSINTLRFLATIPAIFLMLSLLHITLG